MTGVTVPNKISLEYTGTEDPGTLGSPGTAPVAPVQCSCDDCVGLRAAMRELALAELRVDLRLGKRTWATRSWDGPLARFPGAPAGDTARHLPIRQRIPARKLG